ncbi:hypothetical protein C6I20_06545 [Aeromicrobium sp. A1-2]|nr:hypothetical protein C6I20_06545 [Aeromicrobium sp. A1-2]
MPEDRPNSEARALGDADDSLAEIVDAIKVLARLHPDVTSISVTSGQRSITVARPEHTAPVGGQSPAARETPTRTQPGATTAPPAEDDQPAARHRRAP